MTEEAEPTVHAPIALDDPIQRFAHQIADLPDKTLAEMTVVLRTAREERAHRVEEEICNKFIAVLELLESCFSGSLLYTSEGRTKEGFRDHPEKRSWFLHYATRFPHLLDKRPNLTALDVLNFLFKDGSYGIFVYSQCQQLNPLGPSRVALAAYLNSIAWPIATDTGLSVRVREEDVFDPEDTLVQKHASPVWLANIRVAFDQANATKILVKARAVLEQVHSADALTTLFLERLHSMNRANPPSGGSETLGKPSSCDPVASP